jgi:hypothetical protein
MLVRVGTAAEATLMVNVPVLDWSWLEVAVIVTAPGEALGAV